MPFSCCYHSQDATLSYLFTHLCVLIPVFHNQNTISSEKMNWSSYG